MIYIIGSLRNPEVPKLAKRLRDESIDVFAEWFAAGPEADDKWRDYEESQGFGYLEALCRPAAQNVFAFDKRNLDRSEAAILLLPAGRSGFMELGYAIGTGKRAYILLDSPDRWDVMLQFASGIYTSQEALIAELKSNTSANLVPEVSYPDSRLFCNPAESIYCGRCADCIRNRGNLRGSGPALTPELIGVIS